MIPASLGGEPITVLFPAVHGSLVNPLSRRVKCGFFIARTAASPSWQKRP
jgi:hypothetical protein